MVDIALQHISKVVAPLYKKSKRDRRSKILYDVYYSQSSFLRLRPKDKEHVIKIIEQFAARAVKEKWNDVEVPEKSVSIFICTVISDFCLIPYNSNDSMLLL